MEVKCKCKVTYRPTDEEHSDCTHDGHISNQRLKNHAHHPVQLKEEKQYGQINYKIKKERQIFLAFY